MTAVEWIMSASGSTLDFRFVFQRFNPFLDFADVVELVLHFLAPLGNCLPGPLLQRTGIFTPERNRHSLREIERILTLYIQPCLAIGMSPNSFCPANQAFGVPFLEGEFLQEFAAVCNRKAKVLFVLTAFDL